MNDQLTFWPMPTPVHIHTFKTEYDSFFLWKRAVREYDLKRWKAGWRPWYRKEKQNAFSS